MDGPADTSHIDRHRRGRTPYIKWLLEQVKNSPPEPRRHGKLRSLTNDQVREIRRDYEPYKCPAKTLAKRYGVGRSTIQDIVSGKTYKNVK